MWKLAGLDMVCDNPAQPRGVERRMPTLWKWQGSWLDLESRVLLCHPLPGAFPREGITQPGLFAEKPRPFPVLRYMAVAPITPLQHPIEGQSGSMALLHISAVHSVPCAHPSVCTFPRAGVDLGELRELPTLRGTLCFPPCPEGLETTPLHLFWALPVHTREESAGIWHAWLATHSISFHEPDCLPRYCSPMMGLWGLGRTRLGSWRLDRAAVMLSPSPPVARALPGLSPPHKLCIRAEIIYF